MVFFSTEKNTILDIMMRARDEHNQGLRRD